MDLVIYHLSISVFLAVKMQVQLAHIGFNYHNCYQNKDMKQIHVVTLCILNFVISSAVFTQTFYFDTLYIEKYSSQKEKPYKIRLQLVKPNLKILIFLIYYPCFLELSLEQIRSFPRLICIIQPKLTAELEVTII